MEIQVEALTKVYRVPVKDPGLWGSVKSVFARKYREVRAVDAVSFHIDAGERVGFLGPNGAGKTTTLKMLTGLLHPTSGKVTVAGHIPQARPRALLRAVTLVMGQKQQLIWDLPPSETFAMNRALFDLPRDQFQASLKELVELLDLGPLLDKPTRTLSLGERMRCELAAALLHRPKILFLDEPTIGLDVQVQQQVRHFVDEYNKRHGATVMLTSHDMGDVSHLARRILLIDHGVVRFDGSLDGLRKRFGTGRKVLARGAVGLTGLEFVKEEEGRYSRMVPAEQVNRVLGAVLQAAPQAEVTVMDPPLEEVLTRAFGETRAKDEQGAA